MKQKQKQIKVNMFKIVMSAEFENTPSGSTHTLHFTPPLEMFPMCHYMTGSQPEPPMKGFYQMKVGGSEISVNNKREKV